MPGYVKPDAEREWAAAVLSNGGTYRPMADRWGLSYTAARMQCRRWGLRSLNDHGRPKGSRNLPKNREGDHAHA